MANETAQELLESALSERERERQGIGAGGDDAGEGLPPGPSAPATVQTMRFVRDPWGYLDRCSERYGDVVRVKLFGFGPTVWVSRPRDVRAVYENDAEMPMSPAANLVTPIFGTRGVTHFDWSEHLHRRRQLLPPFGPRSSEAYLDLYAEAADREIDSWEPGSTVELLPAMFRIALEVMIRTLMGIEDARTRINVRDALLDVMDQLKLCALGNWIRRDLGPWSPWGRFLAKRRRLDELLYREIEIHRLSGRQDVLAEMIEMTNEDGTPLTDEDLRDDLVNLLVAGSETTATSLAWMLDLLGHHPTERGQIIDELAGEEGSVYLDAAIKEALRLRPPVIASGRVAITEVTLGGYRVPPGTRVWAAAALVNRRPDTYPDPDRFLPERFLERRGDSNTWIPFGGGVHRCLGAPFALLEMRTVMRAILSRVSAEPARSELEPCRANGAIIVPAHGAPFRIVEVAGRAEVPIEVGGEQPARGAESS